MVSKGIQCLRQSMNNLTSINPVRGNHKRKHRQRKEIFFICPMLAIVIACFNCGNASLTVSWSTENNMGEIGLFSFVLRW